MSIINEVECTKVLVLDKRLEWYSQIEKQLKAVGLKPDMFLAGDGYTAKDSDYWFKQYDFQDLGTKYKPPLLPGSIQYATWFNRVNAYNAFYCHNLMMRRALDEGHNNLMIIEDDIMVEEDFLEIVGKCEDFFANNEWDMIYFGAYHKNTTEKITEEILKVKGSGGWHGVLMKKNIMEELVPYSQNPIGPYDWICGQHIHQKYNCYAIYPSVISQRSCYSHVEGHHLDKPSRYMLD